MRLNINSPAYYSQVFGVDNEIYNMCQEISRFMRDKNYSETVDTIGIVPIIAPKELIKQGKWKEEIKYDLKHKIVFVSKHIDYDVYNAANIKEKKILILDNIIESIKSIQKKSKLDFEQFSLELYWFVDNSCLI